MTAVGNDRCGFFLDVVGAKWTSDTFDVVIETVGLFNQFGSPVAFVPYGVWGESEDSGFVACITDSASPDCRLGLSPFNLDATPDTDSLFSATWAALNNTLEEIGDIPFAQIVISPGGRGTYSVRFINHGSQVDEVSGVFGVPEPTTCTLALAALCLAMSKRRIADQLSPIAMSAIVRRRAQLLTLA
jgi:hypothetical protein